MDGDIDATSEAAEQEQAPEQEHEQQKTKKKKEVHVSPEQLVGYLRAAHFEGTRNRRGYQIGEVNAFLVRLVDAVEAAQPLADLVHKQRFTTVRLEHGYEMHQVDDFLKAVVDLDPHPRSRPEIARSGLITKLFGS